MKYKEFINPYHFLPLGDGCKRGTEKEDEEVYSGDLTVELTNRTKMLIPAGRERGDQGTLEFFTYSNEKEAYKEHPPVIPGSSLRGMLRSVYEMATDSCLSALDTSKPIYRRISDPGKPALLHRTRGEMRLCMGIDVEKEKIGSPLDKSYEECEYVEENGKQFIYLKGENFGERKVNHYRFIIPKGSGNVEIEVKDQMQERFEKTLSVYQDKGINKATGHKGYQKYAKVYNRFKRGKLPANGYSHDYFPVYCHEVKIGKRSEYYITPAAISKEIFRTSLEEILENKGEYQPCRSVNCLCPACSLFGMVGKGEENGAESLKGRVRITDAAFLGGTENLEDHYDEACTLEELSMPRLSNLEFYFKRPEGALNWTPDYYVNEKGQIVWNDSPEIMGRKFYWHHPAERLPEVEKNERNSSVRLLKKGRQFQYKIYFERLRKIQIKQLVFLCNLSKFGCENGEAKYGFRLGMGKPLGLGSCESCVTQVRIRRWTTDKQDGKRKISPAFVTFEEFFGEDWKDMDYETAEFSAKKENFLLMTSFDAVKDTKMSYSLSSEGADKTITAIEDVGAPQVSYPLSNGQSVELMGEGYRFFVKNRYGSRKGEYSNHAILKRKDMIFQQNLEPLNGTVQKLHVNGDRCSERKEEVREVLSSLGGFYAVDSSEEPATRADQNRRSSSKQESGQNQGTLNKDGSAFERETGQSPSGQNGSGGLQIGDIVVGEVTGTKERLGAFVKLENGASGLIHISQIANKYVTCVADELQKGEKVRVKVINIKDNGQLDLSLKDV